MTYEIALKEEAVVDLAVGFDWYDHNRQGLGAEFLQEVEKYLKRLEQDPFHFPVVKNKRKKEDCDAL